MAKPLSKVLHLVNRFIKGVVGLLLIPPAVGLALGIHQQLEEVSVGSRSFAQWMMVGAISYVGIHLFVYKPRALWRVQHRLLSRVALWLFGGQVTTANTKSEPPTGKKSSKASGEGPGGSALLVLSPYLVPLYPVLVCVIAWVLSRWAGWEFVMPVASFLIGASLLLHWVMAADELQQDRNRFPIESYLMALAIIAFSSLLIVGVCVPMVAEPFSLPGVFAEMLDEAKEIYTTVIHRLFF